MYFPVKDEDFFFAVYVDIEPEVAVRWVGSEAAFSVYFSVVPEDLTAEEIEEMTILKPTGSWSKGDKCNNGFRHFTKVMFEPNKEPDEFEDKIKKLIDYLLTDRESVIRLVNEYGGYIQVAASFHNGNSMLGGVNLSSDIIKALADLNLSIDFDLYAEGNLFLEDTDYE